MLELTSRRSLSRLNPDKYHAAVFISKDLCRSGQVPGEMKSLASAGAGMAVLWLLGNWTLQRALVI